MNKNIGLILIIFVALFLTFSLSSSFFHLYIDWLFFEEMGFLPVFKTMLSSRIAAGLLFSAIFLVFYLANIFAANRINFPARNLHIFGNTIYPTKTFSFERPVKLLSVLGGIGVAFLTGLFGASQWQDVLLFMQRIDVGMSEPLFSRDLGFYLFALPVVETLKNFCTFTIVFTAVVSMTGYLLRGGIAVSEKNISLDPRVRRHIGVFGIFGFALLAFHFYIEAFRILYSRHDMIYGAGYTDIYARLITMRLLIVLTVITGIAFITALAKGSFKWVLVPAALTIIVYVGGIVVYAPLLQKFKVAPNELEIEKPYINNNIQFTRYGYDLNRIELNSFDVSYELGAADIANNNATNEQPCGRDRRVVQYGQDISLL